MSIEKKNIVITSASRTAIGTFRGSLKNMQAHELGSFVAKDVLKKSNLQSDDIDELIMGQVLTGGAGQNPARQAAINIGLPVEKTAYVINQVCGSGLRSVVAGYQAIMSNDSNIVIAGGQESMSNAPHYIKLRKGEKINEDKIKDSMIIDGLWDVYNEYHMGMTAENVAKKFNIKRQDQDKFALNSQEKAIKAIKEKKFINEIVPVEINNNIYFEQDEHPRENTSIEKLSELKTVFKKDGTVTPGNSSGINDGAAAVCLMTFENVKKKKIKPLAKIVSWAQCGVDPSIMGTGPIPASKLALKKAGWDIKELELIESNEAFAAQSIAVNKELGWETNNLNVNGGAIALGHPIGASGARILVTLIHEMQKRKVKKGLATLCVGGGMGIAMCIENIV